MAAARGDNPAPPAFWCIIVGANRQSTADLLLLDNDLQGWVADDLAGAISWQSATMHLDAGDHPQEPNHDYYVLPIFPDDIPNVYKITFSYANMSTPEVLFRLSSDSVGPTVVCQQVDIGTSGSIQCNFSELLMVNGADPASDIETTMFFDSNGTYSDWTGDIDDVCVYSSTVGSLPSDQSWTKTGSCPFSSCGEQQHYAGDPINTFSGNYNYQVTDLAIPAVGQETYVFTTTGRLTKHLDPQGNPTVFTYTNGITLTRVADAASGRYLDFSYDSQGRMSQVTDQTGRKVKYGYNGNGDLTTVNDTRGLTWTYTYSGNTHYLHQISDPDGKVVEKTFFNSQGQATRQEDGLGQPIIQITYPSTYTRVMTEAGQVLTDTYNALNLLTNQVDALNNALTYTFDSSFNRTSSADANGNSPTAYDRTPFGLTTAITDALGFTITFSYDGRNNLTRTVDARGNRTRLTYPGGRVVTYTYDTANRLATARDWTNVVFTYTYDAADRLTNLTLPNGITSSYTYDAAGQLTRLAHQNSSGDLSIYEYKLDLSGNRKRVTETLVTPADGAQLGGFSLGSGPDSSGEPMTLTETLLISGSLMAPPPDSGSGQIEPFTVYLPLLLKESRPAASTSHLPTPNPQSLTPGPTLYLPLITKSDPALSAAVLAGPAITRTIVYTYDPLYRLTNAAYTTGESYTYTYDAAGNRKSQTALNQTTVYTYDAASHLTQANGQAYTWDNTGNLQNTGVMTNVFDVANRLTSTTRATNTFQIAYNGLNDRVRQTVGASTTHFALDVATGLPEVISTTNGTTYLHLPGVIMAQNAAGQRVYLLSDGLGGIRQVISGTTVTAWREYEPYGQPRAASAFTDTFSSSLAGWAFFSSYANPGVLPNPPGLMRLASPGNPSGITVRKALNAASGSLTISTVFTVASYTTLYFWVEYTDGSIYYIFANGTTPPGTYTPSYTTPVDKVAVALYFYAAASGGFPPYQIDVDEVRVTPAGASQAPVSPGYGFTGEWWEQDGQLLHLRARWYLPSDGIFLSKDSIESEPPYLYVHGNPVNLTDPSGYQVAEGVLVTTCTLALPACGAAATVAAATIGVVVIIAGPFVLIEAYGDFAAQHPELVWRPKYGPGPVPVPAPAPPRVYPDTQMGTGENPLSLPRIYQAPRPQPGGTPGPRPTSTPPPFPIPTCPPDDDNNGKKVLTVGESDNAEYSINLWNRHSNWDITVTRFGNGSNLQQYITSYGNLKFYTNVDATQLHSGWYTRKNKYDAIIFNNPHAGSGSRTASLISGFKRSARMVLSPGGEIHINVTKQLLYNHLNVAQQLGLSNNEASTVENLPSFGQSKYYAPFIPRYTTGTPMPFYESDSDRAQYLKNFVFR